MKKTLALFLSMLMLLSAFGVLAAADDEATSYTVTFIVKDLNGNEILNESQTVAAGEKPIAPENPQGYTTSNGTVYEFSGWISSLESNSDKRYYQNTMPVPTADVVFTAEFVVIKEPSSSKPGVTMLSFLQNVFRKIGQVFAAATETVISWTKHIGKGSDFVRDLFDNVF